jgi:hypothetical protein
MNTAREISRMSEAQCIQALATTAQPQSEMWYGITARLQQLRLEQFSDQTAKLAKQAAELVAIAEAQRVLAAKLDGQTDTLIGLTRALKALTIWLVILTVILCAMEAFRFFEARKSPIQVAPHAQQTNQNAQQKAKP